MIFQSLKSLKQIVYLYLCILHVYARLIPCAIYLPCSSQGQTLGERVHERELAQKPVPRLHPPVLLRRARHLLPGPAGAREGDLRHHRDRQERPGEAQEEGEEEEEEVKPEEGKMGWSGRVQGWDGREGKDGGDRCL